MGLFDKILDGIGVDKKSVEKFVGDLGIDTKSVEKFVGDLIDGAKDQNAKKASEAETAQSSSEKHQSDDSWSDVMPTEENQYNFNGTYIQFSK